MWPYRHPKQRPWHLFRHGFGHFVHHFGKEDHSHQREFVPRKNRQRDGITYLLVGVGLILLALVALVLFSIKPLIDARDDLDNAHSIISADLTNKALLESARGRAQLQVDIGTASEDAAKAQNSLRGSESLRLLGHLPVVGTQRAGVLALTSDLETVTTTANALLAALTNLTSHSHGTTVSLSALASMQAYVEQGHHALAGLNRSSRGLLGPIASARTSFDHEDAKLVRLLALSSRTIAFARPFLGSDGPRTYLIAGQNNAEMRDGGAVLSLDLLTAANGTFRIAHDASYGDYALTTPAPVALPAGTEQIFGAYGPTENWPDTDATADWALSGESMQGMWQESTGQHVDGVLGLDVPGVADLLKLTGPVAVSGIGQPVSAANVADLLLNKEYAGVTVNDPQNSRRDKIAAVVKAAVDKMKTEHVDLDAFAGALADMVDGRHLMVWSDDPTTEQGLVRLDAAGTLTSSAPNRTFHMAVENSTADKLDYFVGVTVQMSVTVDPLGNALVNSTIAVANFAKKGQPPSYQYGPDGVNAFTPGEYGARIFFWGPTGARVPGAVDESGLQLTQSHFSLLPGQHNLVRFATVIPHAVVDGRLLLRLVPQARLIPDQLSVTISAPGWDVTHSPKVPRHWGSTLNLQWDLDR